MAILRSSAALLDLTRSCVCGQFIVPVRTAIFSSKVGYSRYKIARMQKLIGQTLDPINWKETWKEDKLEILKEDHKFLPMRHKILGPELAAAHFLVARGAKVKFHEDDHWVSRRKGEKYVDLPSKEVPGMCLEAIDASGMVLIHQSFDNLGQLSKLQYLDLSRSPHIDDWFLDRLVEYRDSLLVLDLSECPLVSERGIASLHRLHKLRILRVHKMAGVRHKELVALMLEEALPSCEVQGIDYTNLETQNEDPASELPSFITQVTNRLDKEESKKINS